MGTWGAVGETLFGVRQPMKRQQINLGQGVFGEWRRRNRTGTIPHAVSQLEASGTMDNFRRIVGTSAAGLRGMVFQDSDLYKTLEGVAWSLGEKETTPERDFFEESVALLAAAQAEDGYLNSYHQGPDRAAEPWSDLTHNHELYCLGHLIQAAVAAHRALDDDRLLTIARRFSDLAVRRFGADSAATCGHPEVEMSLVELFRVTGDRSYLELAAAFIDRRGNGFIGEGLFGPQYYQDDQFVRDTSIMRGHAVRALYLNAGATDVYLETGDASLIEPMLAQWDDMVGRRLYITGGTGSRHRDEAFGDAYELPSERAYAETCAGIALIQWAWRMHLATGDARYFDQMEQALYNVVAAGVSDDGRAFFYSNPLQRRGDHVTSQEESAGARLPWFKCACCPPNVARTFASIEQYIASVGEDDIRVGLFADATLEFGGVTLRMQTAYPADGAIRIAVAGESDATLRLRMPNWAESVAITVDSRSVTAEIVDAWLVLDNGVLSDGTVIELTFAMAPVVLEGHPEADGIRGSVAVQRGPVVYCVEEGDNAQPLESLRLLVDAEFTVVPGTDSLGPRLAARTVRVTQDPAELPLYRAAHREPTPTIEADMVLRPYAGWGNHDRPGGMRVWIPRADR